MRGLYHQIHGGQKLGQATNPEELSGLPCLQDFTPNATQISLLQRSVKDFDAALQYDNNLAQAHLLRGRALCLLDKPQKAVRAFQAYIALRPNNPLGHVELGFNYERLGQKEQAVLEWAAAGISWQDFFLNGESARRDMQYRQAIQWFQRANWLTPKAGDPYYAAGMAYQSQGDWEQAISSYKAALAAGLLQDIHPGNIYYRLGLVYQSDSEFQNLDMALEMYHNVLTYDAQSSDEIRAEAHYKIGEIYFWQGRDELESIAEYRQALILNPFHRWAHLRLGRALYDVYHDVNQAEIEIYMAVDLWPEDASKKLPYRILGDIYQEAGDIEQATQAYQEALQYDPTDQEIVEKLAKLLEQ
jgi:tetratricopeptide (TPR) repeat protein